MKKTILFLFLILIAAGGGIAYWMWNKPHDKAEDQDAIKITATELFQKYEENNTAANTAYNGKWLEVTGTVLTTETNQDGFLAVMLETGDMMSVVMCTMRDKGASIKKAEQVTIKGMCTGHATSDVTLTDCILIKQKMARK